MEQILIGGYTLDELKKIQAAVKKDASKIISDAIDRATGTMEEMLTLDNEEDKEKLSGLGAIVEENLTLAKTVSSISDVEYYLPYSSDYDSDGFYYRFESDEVGTDIESVDRVMGLLEDMEHQSRQWNQSTC